MAIIGRRNTLSIERSSGPGLYLNGGELGEILLPGRYIPAEIKPGDKLDVFVYLDSEDRLVATTEIPKVMVGEFACLKVVSINARVGAFLDWGLAKDLLLPFREQEVPVRVGKMVAVFVYLDPTSNRIVASARLRRHLNQSGNTYQEKQPVNLLITGRTPLGYNAIVENDRFGLLYHNSLGIPLEVGEKIKGFIRTVREDGKLDLTLDKSGYQRVIPLKQQIVTALENNGGHLKMDDDSSPLSIRMKFGCSKNAFKQALGALYNARRIAFEKPGIRLLENAEYSPGQGAGARRNMTSLRRKNDGVHGGSK
jgi:predicted RNA-binding protein (virulence factor B family)